MVDLGPGQKAYSEHGGVAWLRMGWMGWGGGWGEGRSKQAAPVPTLCMQLSPQTLEGSPSKDSAPRDLPLSALTYARAHPQTGVAPSSLPDTKAATQYHASSKKLPVTTDYHFLNPHHHQPHPFSIFVLTYFGRVCEQFQLDLYVSKLGWKTSKFGGFEPPGVLVSPSPVSTAAPAVYMYELECNFTLHMLLSFYSPVCSSVHVYIQLYTSVHALQCTCMN